MKGQIETRLGTIVIGNEVIATCAGSREFDSRRLENYLAGRIKPAFFMSIFLFYFIVFYCNV